jgi:hypothetical protein
MQYDAQYVRCKNASLLVSIKHVDNTFYRNKMLLVTSEAYLPPLRTECVMPVFKYDHFYCMYYFFNKTVLIRGILMGL